MSDCPENDNTLPHEDNVKSSIDATEDVASPHIENWDTAKVEEFENILTLTDGTQSPGRGGAASAEPDVDGYEILGHLGEGGMATVWRARQLSTRREVALKLIGRGAFASEKARIRFEREVELAARLEHPNIARVYDSGLQHGNYHYAMELIDGVRLDEYVKTHKLEVPEILELMQAVCDAVQFAHQRGVIHRDLKPSNILVTQDGKPYVLDFGLAKSSQQDDHHVTVSLDGDIAGTPAFMSPEQAAGNVDMIDTRSDVYSLGVILYNLLTGQSPHDLSCPRYEVFQRIAEQDVRRPREVCQKFNRELESILLKALAHKPADRYGSVGELANDLENFLTGEPLIARKPTTFYFLRKRMRKHSFTLGVITLILVGIIAGVAFYIHSIRAERDLTFQASLRAKRQQDSAEVNALRAMEQRDVALKTLNHLVFKVQRIASRQAGSTKLRKELLAMAMDGLDRFAASSDDTQAPPDRELAGAMLILGDVCLQGGDVDAARTAYQKALTQFQNIFDINPSEQAASDLCVAQTRMGRICLQMGESEKARKFFQSALQTLDNSRLDNFIKLKNRWALLISLGDIDLAGPDYNAAMQRFLQSLVLARELKLKREESTSLKRLGGLSLRQDQPGKAERFYAQALEIDRQLVQLDDEDMGARKSLALSLEKLAEAELQHGSLREAREHATEAEVFFQTLAEKDPDAFEIQIALAVNAMVMGDIELRGRNNNEARRQYDNVIAKLRALEKAGKLAGQPAYLDLLKKAEEKRKAVSGN